MTNLDERILAVTINDACAALSLGRNSIYNLIADGKLQAIKIGRTTRIPTASIKALLSAAGVGNPTRGSAGVGRANAPTSKQTRD